MMKMRSFCRATSNLLNHRRHLNNKVKLSFREITEKDFDAVMSIRMSNKQYDGRDYLADYYMVLLQTPGYKGYATFANGKMVNFIFVVVLDEGKTMAVLATRTRKEYCGKGILKSAVGNAVEQNYKNNPNLKYISGVYNKDMYDVLLYPNVVKGLKKLVQKKELHAYKISSNKMLNNFGKYDITPSIENISHQDLENIFQKESVQEIFPRKLVLTNWIPYECSTSNISRIFNGRCTIFGTDMKRNARNEQGLLTFGHFSRLPFALYYGIDIYGQNISALSEHVLAHLNTLKQFKHDEVTLALSYHDAVLNKSYCDQVADYLGFESNYDDQQYCTAGYINDLRHIQW